MSRYPQDRLRYIEYSTETAWPKDPNISAIGSIAFHHLHCLTSITCVQVAEESAIDVAFFAEGAYDKLYLVSITDQTQEYLFRVSLPFDPCFKTESEVSTVNFVRRHTTVPVAEILA
ncbi:MAG: Phosphotransferase enzyme [Icmadophila ericetorum]|nr:Phosphotransferase enzyme [Icmadophila ericetorum]